MHPVKLLERAASGATHAVRHPISTTAYAAGMLRGLAGAVVHGATFTGHDLDAGSTAPQASRGPERVAKPVPDPADLPEPVVIEPSEQAPGESFATEPTAVSRESAHGGAPSVDAEVDEWEAEAAAGLEPRTDVDVETPVGTTGAGVGHNPDTAEADLQQPGTEPLLEPGTAKAIRSESETLRRAADPGRG